MGRELPSGTITILFSDVVGSTALTTARGDEPAHAILRRQRELVRREIEQHSGHEVKTMGDGFMVVFASARQAVSCAIAIQRAIERHSREHRTDSVAVRIGLNTGEAIAEGADYFGAAVTAAERVQEKAAGGEILVSESVRAVLGPASDVRLADRGRFRLKGFPERARLFEVIWRETPPPAPPGMAKTPFISRAREVAMLRDALGRAAAGRGALVLIAGEPGVGKTRLAEEIAAEAQANQFVSFVGRCYEDTDGPPYGPFVEIMEAAVRRLDPDTLRAVLGESLPDVARILPAVGRMFPNTVPSTERPPEIARRQLFSSVRDFLVSGARRRSILLIIDDLHWADDATLQLMRHLARMVHEMPALVVATFRDGPADVGSPFAQALDEWHRRRLATRIDLHPFTPDELRSLLRELNGQPAPEPFVRALQQETGGNAFFVEELVRHLTEERMLFDRGGAWRPDLRIASLPPGVRVVVDRRLDRLGQDARGVLAAAAVLGHTFDAEMTERVTGASDEAVLDAIDRAERAGVMVPDSEEESTLRFAHSLTRTVLLGGLTSSERQRLHLVAARALAERHGDAPERAAELARHYLAAGHLADRAVTIDALRRAGNYAAHLNAYREADGYLKRALEMARDAPELSPVLRADLMHEAGRTLYLLGRFEESRGLLDRADEGYTSAGEMHRRAGVLFSKAALATYDGRPGDAVEELEKAKTLAGDDERLMTEILQAEAQALVQLRMYPRAAEVVDQALSSAERLGDAYMTAQVRVAAAFLALSSLDMPGAVARYASALSAPGSRHQQMAAESRRALALSCIGRLDEAEASSAVALAYFRRMVDPGDAGGSTPDERDPYESGVACLAASIPAIARGRFDDALAMLRESVDAASSNAEVTRMLLPAIVQIHHTAGRFDGALQCIGRWLPVATSDARRPVFARIYDALSSAARGDTAGPAALPAPPPRLPDLQSLAVTVLAAETAVVREDAAAAAQQIDAIRYLDERGMLFTSGWVALVPRLLGGLLRVCGDVAAAEQQLGRAVEIAEASGAAPEAALTRLEMALVERARGEPGFEAARAHAAEARRLLTKCGVRAHDRRLTRLVSIVVEPQAIPGGLADEDQALLRMVAMGQSNQRIALEMEISVPAVQRRLGQLYARIGVTDRRGAIAYAYRHGIVSDSAS